MKKYQFDKEAFEALEKLKVPLAIYQFIDKRVVTVLLSDGFCELFGFDTNDKTEAYYIMDNDMYEATHPDDKARVADEAFRFATQGGKYEVIYRTYKKNKEEYIIVHSIGEHVYTKEGVRLAYVWYTDEGSYTKESDNHNTKLNAALRKSLHKESIINSGYYDFLTGLPSMSYFFELADIWRTRMHEEGKTSCLLYMDLCGMKYFNRKYGFAEGDDLLRRFSVLLKKHFSNENCSRFGSDHFCVYTEGDDLESKLKQIFKETESYKGNKSLPVRVGICLDSDSTLDISIACDRAKYACDTMRNTFISNFRYFNDSMLSKAETTQYIIDNLDKAIKEKCIQVYYQPIIRAANGRVCDEEALARWIDPQKGALTPSDFIPILEEANLIYKLDLCVLDQILEKLIYQNKAGLYIVPQSLNLSRIDFDTCDIVEEVRQRVDASGINRSMINIELTESAIGDDFEFMKAQIERFRQLGFNVWLDDFGSGYSSLDLLQSINCDLIKFDIRFMNEFSNGDKSKIILTELVKMAIALGIDTVCEGVETEEQVEFLKVIGCTKLQGFYFCRPIPLADILKRYSEGIQIGFENPDETDYYAAIGKINLYDLAILSNEDQKAFEHYFNTLPMAIIESSDKYFRLVRCNNTFRSYVEKLFGSIAIGQKVSHAYAKKKYGARFISTFLECGEYGNKLLVYEKTSDGSVAHVFMKKLAFNEVSGTKAIAIAVLDIIDGKNAPMTFTHVAKALSSDYISLYYVDLLTDRFVEYKSDSTAGELSVERHGSDFFAASRRDAMKVVYEKDRDAMIDAFRKDNIIRSINDHGAFTMSYRLIVNGNPTYVSLKAVRPENDPEHIIIGVNNIDAQMREKETVERIKQEWITFSRITALSEDFICIYTVDPKTGKYLEYSAVPDYEKLGIPKVGKDFFGESLESCTRMIYTLDLENFRSAFSKEKIMREIKEKGMFKLIYRLMMDSKPVWVCLKAALVEEKDGPQLIIGVTNIDSRFKINDEYEDKQSRQR